MYLQGVDSIFDIVCSDNKNGKTYYKDIHKESEIQFSKYNFEVADIEMLITEFNSKYKECKRVLKHDLPLPAYDLCISDSNIFNILDSPKALSKTERANYILQIRDLSKGCAQLYKKQELERIE